CPLELARRDLLLERPNEQHSQRHRSEVDEDGGGHRRHEEIRPDGSPRKGCGKSCQPDHCLPTRRGRFNDGEELVRGPVERLLWTSRVTLSRLPWSRYVQKKLHGTHKPACNVVHGRLPRPLLPGRGVYVPRTGAKAAGS